MQIISNAKYCKSNANQSNAGMQVLQKMQSNANGNFANNAGNAK
jgi:hypothetical protein